MAALGGEDGGRVGASMIREADCSCTEETRTSAVVASTDLMAPSWLGKTSTSMLNRTCSLTSRLCVHLYPASHLQWARLLDWGALYEWGGQAMDVAP